jgi:hypothetical protein
MGTEHLVQLEVAQRRVRVCWRCGLEWPVAREMCPECAVGIAEGERDQYYTHVVADGAALGSRVGFGLPHGSASHDETSGRRPR